ncbi:MAG: protein phosphatase 2C domain-containing protein [Mariniphaga sp.]|nr:protein phosphatase 2C domain-containing protein [Mariniphaga sp.]
MKNIITFHSTALGESHRVKNKVCQDAADSFEDSEKGLFICAVSDGHGSDSYFRSDRGSELLVKIAVKAIREFIENIDQKLLTVPFTAIPARNTELKNGTNRQETKQDVAFRRLFSSIISLWNDEIYKDWMEDTPTLEEMQVVKVPETALNSFVEGKNIEIAYGCTLIALARTSEYWFGFQLGDGKCIAFDSKAEWNEPIPWDEKCSGNTTTSICESDALDSFRYCYGNTDFPPAVFIGSDGLDGAYGDIDEFALPGLAMFYSGIIKSFEKNGVEKTQKEIDDSLPILSATGIARDDMSLAGIVDLDEIPLLIPIFRKKELERAKQELESAINIFSKKKENVLLAESSVRQKQEETDRIRTSIKQIEEIIATEKNKLVKFTEDLKKSEIEVQNEQEVLAHLQKGFEKATKEKEELQRKIDTLLS